MNPEAVPSIGPSEEKSALHALLDALVAEDTWSRDMNVRADFRVIPNYKPNLQIFSANFLHRERKQVLVINEGDGVETLDAVLFLVHKVIKAHVASLESVLSMLEYQVYNAKIGAEVTLAAIVRSLIMKVCPSVQLEGKAQVLGGLIGFVVVINDQFIVNPVLYVHERELMEMEPWVSVYSVCSLDAFEMLAHHSARAGQSEEKLVTQCPNPLQ